MQILPYSCIFKRAAEAAGVRKTRYPVSDKFLQSGSNLKRVNNLLDDREESKFPREQTDVLVKFKEMPKRKTKSKAESKRNVLSEQET